MCLTALMLKEGISFMKREIQMSSFLFSRGGINYASLSSFVIITRIQYWERIAISILKVNCRHVN